MTTDPNFAVLTRPFAEAILPLADALRQAPKTSKQRTALSGTLQHLIRKVHDMLEVERPPSASAAALALAEPRGAWT